jgi:hypothetical protein
VQDNRFFKNPEAQRGIASGTRTVALANTLPTQVLRAQNR